MDKIIMKNMAFFSNHGVFEEEKILGQKFFVDAELRLSLRGAGENDDLEKSVNYGEVFGLIKEIVEKERFKLLEALADRLAQEIFREFGLIDGLLLRIKKPEAPVPGIFDYFAVEIERERGDYD